jgi:hypothetical protein
MFKLRICGVSQFGGLGIASDTVTYKKNHLPSFDLFGGYPLKTLTDDGPKEDALCRFTNPTSCSLLSSLRPRWQTYEQTRLESTRRNERD